MRPRCNGSGTFVTALSPKRLWRWPTVRRIIHRLTHRSQAIRLTIANLLTYSRLAAIPVLLALAALHLRSAFLWLLATAWATDLIDGPIARMLGQASARGARLDSVADRGLMVTIPLSVAWLWPEFLMREAVWIALLGVALIVPRAHAFAKFRRLPSYHTWLAKALAVYMALALLLLLNGYWPWLFRVGAVLVLVEALEEIAITHTLDRWRADIPSWWHLRRDRRSGRALAPRIRRRNA